MSLRAASALDTVPATGGDTSAAAPAGAAAGDAAGTLGGGREKKERSDFCVAICASHTRSKKSLQKFCVGWLATFFFPRRPPPPPRQTSTGVVWLSASWAAVMT